MVGGGGMGAGGGGCRMWRENGSSRSGDGRGWRGRKLEDFD